MENYTSSGVYNNYPNLSGVPLGGTPQVYYTQNNFTIYVNSAFTRQNYCYNIAPTPTPTQTPVGCVGKLPVIGGYVNYYGILITATGSGYAEQLWTHTSCVYENSDTVWIGCRENPPGGPIECTPTLYTLNFSEPMNNLVFRITMSDFIGWSSRETFVVTSDSGPVTITLVGPWCYQEISGNTIATLPEPGTGGGEYKISSPNPYTSLTFNYSDGSPLGGSTMEIVCSSFNPIPVTPTPTLTPNNCNNGCFNWQVTITQQMLDNAVGNSVPVWNGRVYLQYLGCDGNIYTSAFSSAGTYTNSPNSIGVSISSWSNLYYYNNGVNVPLLNAVTKINCYQDYLVNCGNLISPTNNMGSNLFKYNLGSQIGQVYFEFSANTYPDRFIVYWNNQIVIDTGFRSDNALLYGPWVEYLNGSPIAGGSTGFSTFMKNISSPSEVYVKVISTILGSGYTSTADYNFRLYCVNINPPSPTPTITPTLTPTNIPTNINTIFTKFNSKPF